MSQNVSMSFYIKDQEMINLGGGQDSNPAGGNKENPFGYKYYPQFLKDAAHPGMCLAHFIFKALGLLSYMFLNIFLNNTTLTFIVVILFGVFDFWVVKNLTGRILVGLRWWSQVNPDGTEEWRFEGLHEKKSGGMDSFIFWTVLYLAPIGWIVFLVSSALSFSVSQITICAACMVLAGTNLLGYMKCSKDHQKNILSWGQNQAMK